MPDAIRKVGWHEACILEVSMSTTALGRSASENTTPAPDSSASPRSPAAILIVTLLTLGSGILNLYSVIGPGVRERVEFLKQFFPLEFVHLSRLLTLLIGFALVVSSINIYRRKRLAWWIVTVLAS